MEVVVGSGESESANVAVVRYNIELREGGKWNGLHTHSIIEGWVVVEIKTFDFPMEIKCDQTVLIYGMARRLGNMYVCMDREKPNAKLS